MHVLYVHRNFPAQFGHIAGYLVQKQGYRCTFVSETAPGHVNGIDKVQYKTRGGATKRTHYCARTFENGIWHAAGVYEALKPLHRHLQPDLIVGHSGFGSTLFLPELFPGTPIINHFEYYYRNQGTDLGFRPEFPVSEANVLRSHARNAMILLDLEACQAGYSPTTFQWSLLPETYKHKVRILHDGVPTDFWRPQPVQELRINDLEIGPEQRVITYVSRGFESMRGFDIFMKVAKLVCDADPNVTVLVVGTDRVCYGGDLHHIKEKSFKEYVLKQDDYDLSRIHFLGRVKPRLLAQMLSRSDVHIYLTVPFVLSWSLLDAMACGCTILASDTAPVREVIRHDDNGLLRDFFDVDGFATTALDVLRDPQACRDRYGRAARRTIEEHFSTEVIMLRMISFYEDVVNGNT
ncbi:MAG: glycosyltransferase [Rhodothermales bacterium]